MAKSELALPPDKQMQVRWVPILAGLVFIALGLLDLLFIVWPLDFMNPLWEFQMSGKVSEHCWPILLGVVLLLMPTGELLDPRTLGIRNGVRLGMLLFACGLLILVPLNLISALRLHRGLDQQYHAWAAERGRHTDVAVEKLEQLETREDVLAFVAPLRFSPDILREEDETLLKAELQERIRGLETGSLQDAQKILHERTAKIWRSAAKASLSLFLLGGIMLGIWRLTRSYKEVSEFVSPEERLLGRLRNRLRRRGPE